MIIDQMFPRRRRAASAISGNRQPSQRVSRDFLVLGLYFAPGDLAVAVGIEPEGVIEVAKCDVPLSGQVITLHPQ